MISLEWQTRKRQNTTKFDSIHLFLHKMAKQNDAMSLETRFSF